MVRVVVVADTPRSSDVADLATDLVSEALREAGCTEISHASSLDAAVPLVTKLRPELVVLDVAESLELEAYRRLIARLRGVPLVAIVPETRVQTAFDAGVADCVVRPLRRTELVARARAALRLSDERARRTKRDRKLSDEIRALQQAMQHLERVACVDALTGVANRRHALALLDAEWKRSVRDGTPLALVMIDLDAFHAFNATYGHPGGDSALRRVTAEMVMCLRRPSDFLGRYGGEEFMAVLANTDAAGARIVAERVCAAVEALAIPHRSSPCASVVTVSVGFAAMQPAPELAVETLVHAADHALLTAKANGRNRVAGEATEAPPRPHLPGQPWRRFPIVVVEPWFASRIPSFLEATRSELAQARTAAQARAFDRIRTVARRLKSEASAHGIDVVNQLAQLLERAARADDREEVDRIVEEIQLYVDHVQVTYRRPHEPKLDQAG